MKDQLKQLLNGTDQSTLKMKLKNEQTDPQRTIYVNNKPYLFSLNDPIFQLSESCKQMVPSKGVCHLCEKQEEVRCDFCQRTSCKQCCGKLFPFPKAAPVEGEQDDSTGLICKLCETKFYIHYFH